jgi:glycosyltransferase involved in cell wall biosynthesis
MASTASTVSREAGERRLRVVSSPTGIASFPPVIPQNPYQRLLYEHLAAHGFVIADGARLKLGWLLGNRGRVQVLHVHWPQSLYRHDDGPEALRGPLSWCRLALLKVRLRSARALGYRIVWTVHQVVPHESARPLLDRAAARALASASDLLLAHDRATVETIRSELGDRARRVAVVPHGSFVDVYPDGRSRSAVRAELGIHRDAFVFLCFGHVRAYKEVDVLLDAFRRTAAADAVLVVAGLVLDPAAAAQVQAAAAADPRIVPLLEFVPDERVAELFGACDAAVLPRGDGGTSGALILALSLGLPAVAADTPVYRELVDDGAAGWLFRPRDTESLRATLERVAGDREAARRKAAAARTRAESLRWADSAARFAGLVRSAARADR